MIFSDAKVVANSGPIKLEDNKVLLLTAQQSTACTGERIFWDRRFLELFLSSSSSRSRMFITVPS